MVLVSFSTFSLVVSSIIELTTKLNVLLYHQKLIGYLNSKNPHIRT